MTALASPLEQRLDAAQIARLLGMTPQGVMKRAKRYGWREEAMRKQGGGKVWRVNNLDLDTRETILPKLTTKFIAAIQPDPAAKETRERFLAECWNSYSQKTNRARERAAYKHRLLTEAMTLYGRDGITLYQAFDLVASQHNENPANLRNWYYGTSSRRGVREIDPKDWLAVLVDGYKGRIVNAGCDEKAWDFLVKDYMRRERSSFSMCYRNLERVASGEGWDIPSERTLRRRFSREFCASAVRYKREGSMRFAYPDQERRRDVFEAGEAVCGDALCFDTLYVHDDVHGTGEVFNPRTWFWEDLLSGKILAHDTGVTENTDMIRRATRNLMDICLPSHAYLDNTTAAANKCMTGGVWNRRRFKVKEDDPVGLMPLVGISVHFTNPPKDSQGNSAGSKPLERTFGIGGLHDRMRHWPAFMGRGHSVKTAIPYSEFLAALPFVVAEHNAQRGRTGGVCNGRSFDEVFAESFSRATVRVASPEARALMERAQEVCTVSRDGTVKINAGKGVGKHRYYDESLARHIGEKVSVMFNPDDLTAEVVINDLEGRRIGSAQWMPSVAFNDTRTGRDYHRAKRSRLKNLKKATDDAIRMSKAEYDMLNNTHRAEPGIIPAPGRSVAHLMDSEVDAKLKNAVPAEQRQRILDTLEKNINALGDEDDYRFVALG